LRGCNLSGRISNPKWPSCAAWRALYGLYHRYSGIFGGRMVVFMNTDDMAERHIETNGLLPLSYHDKRSKTPSTKSVPVLVRPMAKEAA
jgi:hypothetical protein